MKKISMKNLPNPIPVFTTVAWITILHYWNAPEWLYGFFILVFIAAWIKYFNDEEEFIDIFEEPKEEPKKSKFMERLKEIQNEKSK